MTTPEMTFRIVFAAVVGVAMIVRIGLRARAHHRSTGKDAPREPLPQLIVQTILGLTGFALLGFYVVAPQAIAWASVPLPGWLRWLGLPLGLAGTALLAWTHLTLDRFFSGTLQIEEGHQLITGGPYRWMRHPMYTALLAVALAWTLLSASLLIGALWLGTMIGLFFTRMPREEAMLLAQFGDDYRAYMKRTGRLLPRLWR